MMPTQVRCLRVGDMFGDPMDFTAGKVYDIVSFLGSPYQIQLRDDKGEKTYINLNFYMDGKWRFIHPSFRHKTGE